jgi:hypothetical protein
MNGNNKFDPSAYRILMLTKPSTSWGSVNVAFVLDSISTEIYTSYGGNEFYNLSENDVPDRNPNIFDMWWGKTILVWESFVNNHWQLMASIGQYATSGVENDKTPIPNRVALSPGYPNPFNGSTLIRYNVPNPMHVKLTILDVLGRKIETLADTDVPGGERTITWSPRNLASGVYLVRLEAGSIQSPNRVAFVKTQKLIYQK